MKKITKKVPVPVTDEEKIAMSHKLAQMLCERERINGEKAAACEGWNKEIREIDKRSKQLAKAIHTGKDERDVECEEVMVFETNTVQTKRVDTGEIVDQRAMTADERQTSLLADPGSDAATDLELEGDPATATPPRKRKPAQGLNA